MKVDLFTGSLGSAKLITSVCKPEQEIQDFSKISSYSFSQSQIHFVISIHRYNMQKACEELVQTCGEKMVEGAFKKFYKVSRFDSLMISNRLMHINSET